MVSLVRYHYHGIVSSQMTSAGCRLPDSAAFDSIRGGVSYDSITIHDRIGKSAASEVHRVFNDRWPVAVKI